jgi:hypothetical protein
LVFDIKGNHRLRIFENSIMRRIFEPKRDHMEECCRKLCNEKLHNFHFWPNIVRMIMLRMMRWAGHVAYMWRRGMRTGFWWESQNEKDHYEDLAVGGRIILK